MNRSELEIGMVVEVACPELYHLDNWSLDGRCIVVVKHMPKGQKMVIVEVCKRDGTLMPGITREVVCRDLIKHKPNKETTGSKWWA